MTSTATTEEILSPLRHLDAVAVSAAARKESRNREVHLPPVSTFRWWARRTESVNGAIVDAVERDRSGRLLVADPFAGGGVLPLAAAIRGHRVYAQDLNPWAAQGLAAMMALPPPDDLRRAREVLLVHLTGILQKAYGGVCGRDPSQTAISHTFRVARADCLECGYGLRLFPHAVVSLLERKERGGTDCFLACRRGHLFQGRSNEETNCPECRVHVDPAAHYTGRRRVECPECGEKMKLSALSQSDSWGWNVALIEHAGGGGRALAFPAHGDLRLAESGRWKPTRSLGKIPEGQETAVLLRHGFTDWSDLYPHRQRVVLEHLLAAIDERLEGPTREALRVAALGTAEMAGLLSRWDRWYLKSYESMANHRFNFTTFTAEPNVWGCRESGRGTFIRRVDQLIRASEWLEGETATNRHFRVQGPLGGGEERSAMPDGVDVRVVEGSSERMVLPACTVDLVLTDPPYHDDVQYGELSLPFRAWAGQSIADLAAEAVANGTKERSRTYRELLSVIFSEARRTMKEDAHLIFSYANREPTAWADVLWALQKAGLRAAGFQVLHSENETDLAKRGVRACTMDLIMDLVPAEARVKVWSPLEVKADPEHAFLREVGGYFLRVGALEGEWEAEFLQTLCKADFLTDR